ncbi:MAG: sigma-70 family RNA polymerase sigma factor [Planctomycetes bacterium]|nr:sigma-70 family RNA polymerase sigma factor [Planctomycetota bacterium]
MLTTSVGMLNRLNLQKSPEAWESFVNLYGPLLYRWNLKVGLSSEDAKDVSQEVLLHVFKTVHTFERRFNGSFRSWLNRVNYFKMMQFKSLQKKQLDNRPGLQNLNDLAKLVDNQSWAEDYCLDVFNRALTVIESEISHRDWQIFQKIFLNNQTPEEVAGELKCSKRVVYTVQCRVLSKLRVIVSKFIENSI